MPGPKLQMPSALSQMFDMTFGPEGELVSMTLKQDWATLFMGLQQIAYSATRYGTTGNRPTASTAGRYIGMPYFDTTLGLPVFLKTASTSVWVKADGTPA
jgi:hypothetical protein